MRQIFSYNLAALLIRFAVGGVFFHHGAQKVFHWFGGKGFDQTIRDLTSAGIPEPLAYMVPITEFVGAICVILGLLTRFWSAGMVILMTVAFFMVGMKNWLGPVTEIQLLLLAASAALFLNGPGQWAVGDLEGRILGVSGGKA